MWDFLNWEHALANHNVLVDASGRSQGSHGHWDNTTNRTYTALLILNMIWMLYHRGEHEPSFAHKPKGGRGGVN